MHVEARRCTVAADGSLVSEVYPDDLDAVQSLDPQSRFRTGSAAELGITCPAVGTDDLFVVFVYPFGE